MELACPVGYPVDVVSKDELPGIVVLAQSKTQPGDSRGEATPVVSSTANAERADSVAPDGAAVFLGLAAEETPVSRLVLESPVGHLDVSLESKVDSRMIFLATGHELLDIGRSWHSQLISWFDAVVDADSVSPVMEDSP